MNQIKRVLSLALAIGMALSMLVIPANAASFSDISGHWAEKLIEQAVDHGYVPAGGNFQPNKAITRNEFCRMVNGAFGLTAAANISFTDLPASDPYYKDVQKAVSAGYIAGYEDNTFRGNNLIVRQEAAAIIARLVAHPGAVQNMNTLKDASSIAAWAQPAAKIAYTKGYMVGDNLKNFNPLGNLTRAETVKILETILSKEDIISGNITIHAKNETVTGKIYTGNLIISDGIGRSSVQLTNCKVLGTLLVNGGGESGVRLSNTGVANMTVDSKYTEVGVAAVGDSTVYNTYLKTPSQLAEANLSGMGTGFKNVTLGGTATEVELNGAYDTVTVGVAGAKIKLGSTTTVGTANVNTPAAFTGTGTINKANVNASGVTFQKAPLSNGTGSGTGTGSGSTGTTTPSKTLAVTATPANGTTKVSTSTNITLAFEDAIVPTNGQILTTSWVRSNVTLYKNTSTGTAVDYSASISSNGKVLTIDPVATLDKGSEYLLTVGANAFKGKTNGCSNASIAVVFTTDGKSSTSSSSSSTVVYDEMNPYFYPGDETDNIPVDANLTLTFDEKVYDDDGDNLTSSYLKNYVLELRKEEEDGTKVSFSASINSAKKVITINPSSNLSKDTTYYLIVAEESLTNDDGDTNEELIYSFTTAEYSDNVPLATPASGTQVMDTEDNFVFEFPTAVYDKYGDDVTESDIKNAFTIREDSKSSGTKIDFEADISSDGTTITLIPDGLLDEDTDYYVILASKTLEDEYGDYIPGLTFSYYTGSEVVISRPSTTGDLAPIETSPEHKETKVDGADDIKLLFSDDLYTPAGKKVSSSYLEDCIEIRRSSQTGREVSFDAIYDTTYGLNIVKLDPDTKLSSGYTYYVIIKANTLCDADGIYNDKFVFYFTVGSSSTDGIYVDIETDSTSAELTVDYDYSDYADEDVDKIKMTLYYKKVSAGSNSWQTKTATLYDLCDTKTFTLTGLSRNTEYEYEIEVELYDGLSEVDYDSDEGTFETDGYSYDDDEIAISSITVSGVSGSSDYIYYDDFEYDDGVFVGELRDSIEPSGSGEGYLKIKVNADDSDATIYIESDDDYTSGDDNETLYIYISEDEYEDDYVVLYITVEDSDGYETYYELSIWLEY